MTIKERSRLYFAIQKFRDATIELSQSLNTVTEVKWQENYPFEKGFSEVAADISNWLDTLNRGIDAVTHSE